ncbi:hypothetical protein TRFO_33141 [Tritrichomonas foetus]|uniref:Intimal thickness related receptor IRP domain-containing protein n=1 Tax=Tritrichomonas foetus TaxID=1144522 RepID=A0A1J4JM76_9EUKA|nr:hypothetical protein TRFO_33141 [Tritrichomonas foetus]|eukprot:OHT00225.1 hypothetical protein TRFO_33141 [Tritrichomonas foetus]
MLFSFLFVFIRAQHSRSIYSSFNSECRLLNFGFQANGEFDLEINSSIPSYFAGYLISTQETDHSTTLISKTCQNFNPSTNSPYIDGQKFHIAAVNFSSGPNATYYHWRGSVPLKSVYSLYLINCNSNRSTFSIESQFTNPESYLDTRDEIILHIYLVFAFVYFIVSAIWWVNAAIFTNFRVPLHTIFLLLPMIRCLILMLTSSLWGDLRLTDRENIPKRRLIFALNFIYYTVMFNGIAFASAGFCIFRQKIHWKDSFEIIISSICLTFGILLVPYIQDIQQAFLIMAIVVFSVLWYLKQSIVSMIIVTQLMHQMKEPQVVAKVKLAHRFAMCSFSTIAATIIISIYAAAIDSRKSLCASLLEIGLIVNSILQLKFFLFRKQYYGESRNDEYVIKIVKPKTFVEPNGTQMVLLVQKIVVNV